MEWPICNKKCIFTWGHRNENPKNGVTFKINDQRLKPYMEYHPRDEDTEINLGDPPVLD